MKYLYPLILTGFCYIMNAQGPQTNVTIFEANYRDTPPQNALYTDGGDTYSFSQGTQNDLILDAIQIEDGVTPTPGTFNVAVEKLADRIKIRRVDNAGTTGNRHITFFEQASTYGGTTKDFKGNLFTTMEESLLSTIIGSGSDNIFANTSSNNVNNIERIDYIFDDGIVVPANPNEGGFPILERGGNDNFHFAPITALDAQGDPSTYSDVISYNGSDWSPTGISITTSVLSGFTEPPLNEDLIETATPPSQPISIIFISFADMGFTGGETIFGYSLSGDDATTDPALFVDFTNTTNFPTNTVGGSNAGGMDLMAGGALTKKSFIHTPNGWFDNEDPNATTPGCDDLIIVSGGNASITKDMTVGDLTANDGNLNLGTNTLNVCGDMESVFPFSVTGGNLKFIGTTPAGTTAQKISSRTGNSNILTIDNLELDNSLGIEVNANINIKDVLKVTTGDFATPPAASDKSVTLFCDFDNPTGPSPFTRHKVGQIGELTGTITGNITVEQCFPGRRAFRMVSASTTGGTIHVHWQENATAYTDNPNAGFGTHITGVSPDPDIDANPDSTIQDQVNGLDWQPSGNASMFTFNESTQTWDTVLDTETPTLTAGDNYLMMIRGSRAVDLESNASPTSDTKLRSTGTIAKGSVSINPGINNNEFALIGNPFHAVVDLNQVNISGSGYTNSIAVFDPNIGGASNVNPNSTTLGGRGGYVTVDATTGTPSVITGFDVNATDATNQLQPYQAFFVQADASGTHGAITFQETDKNVIGVQSDVFSNPQQSRIFVTLFDQASLDNQSTPDDGLVINFSPESSNAVDDNDAPKFFNQDEVIARNENNSLISFENRAMPVEQDVLNLYIDQYRTTEYVLEVGVEYLPENTAYLIDNYTNTELTLVNNTSNIYNFSVDPTNSESIATDRFKIVFQSTTLGTDDFDQAGISIYPNPVKDKVTLNLSQFNEMAKQLSVYDITGKLINNYNIDNQENYEINMSNYASGVYILKIQTASGQLQHKLIKE